MNRMYTFINRAWVRALVAKFNLKWANFMLIDAIGIDEYMGFPQGDNKAPDQDKWSEGMPAYECETIKSKYWEDMTDEEYQGMCDSI